MTKNKKIRQSVLMMTSCLVGVGFFIITPTLSVKAQDKDVSELSPTGGWSISKMANSGQEYCALSRQYQKDIALTIGQNTTEEYSLAMDFQKSTLNVDKAYSITLQPEAGQIRAYEMMPASKRAMVIRLGYDDSFVKALQRSGQLKAEIDGTKYQFAIPDFQSGNNDLVQCMQSIKGKDTKVASNFKAEKVENAPPIKAPVEAKAPTPRKPNEASLKAPVEQPKPIVIERTNSESIAPSLTSKTDGPEKPIIIKSAKSSEQPDKAIKIAKIEEPKKIGMDRTESKLVPVNPVPAPPSVDEDKSAAIKIPPPIKVEKAQEKVAEAKPLASRVSKSVETKTNFSSRQPPALQKVQQPESPAPVAMTSKADVPTPPPVQTSNADKKLQEQQQAEMERLKEQNAKLQQQQRAELEKLKADNMRLSQTLQSQANKPVKETPDRTEEMSALQQKINQLQTELSKKTNSKDPVDRRLSTDLQQLQAENASLKHAMQILEAQKTSGGSSGSKEQAIAAARLQTELQSLKQENAKLKNTVNAMPDRKVAAVTPAPAPKVEAVPPKDILEANQRMKEEVAKLKSENKELQTTVQSLAQVSKKPEVTTQVEPKVDPAVLQELEKLKAENTRLASAMQGQEDKLDSFDAKDPKAQEELVKIRERMRELEEKNKSLSEEAMQARGAVDMTVVKTGNEAIKAIREYEKKYEAAQADNLTLSKEIEELRRMQEDKSLGAVAGNWDLEKATKRYNEAEREIKRLGLLLEQQRMAHREETTELEGMLFDPAVTERQQRDKLAQLEVKLKQAEQQLAENGIRGKMARRPIAPITPMEERITVTAAPAPVVEKAVNQQLESLEIQRLNNQVNRQNQQLQAYARQQEPSAGDKIGVPRMPQNTIPSIESHPISISSPRSERREVPTAAPVMAGGFGQTDLQQLLGSAGVPLSGDVVKNGATQYRWNAGRLVGKGQILPLAQAKNVDAFAQNYIARARQSCGGDFASLPAPSSGSAKSFEIACVSPTQSTSASLVFAQRGGQIIAIAHEAPTDDLDKAMEARDRIAGQL